MATVKNISMEITKVKGNSIVEKKFNNVSFEKAMHIIYDYALTRKDQKMIDWDQFVIETKMTNNLLEIGGTQMIPIPTSYSCIYITKNF